jgi:hypothetical protein
MALKTPSGRSLDVERQILGVGRQGQWKNPRRTQGEGIMIRETHSGSILFLGRMVDPTRS